MVVMEMKVVVVMMVAAIVFIPHHLQGKISMQPRLPRAQHCLGGRRRRLHPRVVCKRYAVERVRLKQNSQN